MEGLSVCSYLMGTNLENVLHGNGRGKPRLETARGTLSCGSSDIENAGGGLLMLGKAELELEFEIQKRRQ